MTTCLDPLLSCFRGQQQQQEQQADKPSENPTTTAAAAAPATAATMSRSAKVAVIVYSMYGHVAKLSDALVEGLKQAGVEYKVFQIAETLPEEVLGKMHANKAPISDLPVVTPNDLKDFDGLAFGFPTRYGRTPAQVSAFFDQTGGLWASGALVGKFATIFTSTASQHGGLETTQLTTLPFLIHHGINYVPLGYQVMDKQGATDVVIGSSAYGAGTVAGGQGQLQPHAYDLECATRQGAHFGKVVGTFVKGSSA